VVEVVVACWHGNECYGSVEGGGFIDRQSDHQLFKDSASLPFLKILDRAVCLTRDGRKRLSASVLFYK
jgi:hypothetical protein